MLAFPGMLVSAAENAGMSVPEDPDNFSPEEFPHFHVFCAVQLCRPMQPGEQFNNAKVIAKYNSKQIKKITLIKLMADGLHYSC